MLSRQHLETALLYNNCGAIYLSLHRVSEALDMCGAAVLCTHCTLPQYCRGKEHSVGSAALLKAVD